MSKQPTAKTTPSVPLVTERTSAGLRSMLFDELDALRNGTSTSNRANAVAKMASTVIDSVRMELDAARFVERNKLGSKKMTLSLDLAG